MECTSVLVFDQSRVEGTIYDLGPLNGGFEHRNEHETPIYGAPDSKYALTPRNDEKIVHWYTGGREARK